MRRLDRTRDYGKHFPILERRAFVQDGIDFDLEGNEVDPESPPGVPPPPTAPVEGNSNLTFLEVAVPVSRPVLTVTTPKVEVQTKTATLPTRTEREWQTVKFPQLKRDMKKALGVEPGDHRAALKILRERGFIRGV